MRFLCHGWKCSAGFSEGVLRYAATKQKKLAEVELLIPVSSCGPVAERNKSLDFCPQNEGLTQNHKET